MRECRLPSRSRHGPSVPSLDLIWLPQRSAFIGTATSSASESYYSTIFHELTHWAGTPDRCNRDLSGRFGSESYAIEELVAELGAAFLCAEIGINSAPRPDHADHIGSWLECLKTDDRAIFKAHRPASRRGSSWANPHPHTQAPFVSDRAVTSTGSVRNRLW